ncbi:MAG: hypothetical protein RL199_243 [Pseudomonadota bacterium]|jgi:hypothetical protein
MKRPVDDHGEILHWMGAHHLFPVRGASADDVGFASHGELEGRTPIGWHLFFPALGRTGKRVFVDEETGAATVE